MKKWQKMRNGDEDEEIEKALLAIGLYVHIHVI